MSTQNLTLIEITSQGFTKDGKHNLVPVEPTDEMKKKAAEFALGTVVTFWPDYMRQIYWIMLNAAPQP